MTSSLTKYFNQAELEERAQEQKVYEIFNKGAIGQRFSRYLLQINRLKRVCNIAKFCAKNNHEDIAETYLESARYLLTDLKNSPNLPDHYGPLIKSARQEIYFETITSSPQLRALWHITVGVPA